MDKSHGGVVVVDRFLTPLRTALAFASNPRPGAYLWAFQRAAKFAEAECIERLCSATATLNVAFVESLGANIYNLLKVCVRARAGGGAASGVGRIAAALTACAARVWANSTLRVSFRGRRWRPLHRRGSTSRWRRTSRTRS